MALPIDMVSDVVCPWCFIGKRRLEKAIALRPRLAVDVRFRPFFLNPWVPREGMRREDYLTKKFGSPERYRAIANRVVAAAAEEGLVYVPEKITRQPNTLDCHRLILWAAEIGRAACMKQRLMELYFTEGADLSDHDVLATGAGSCGLEPAVVRARLAGDQDVARVEEEAASASAAGISGVPCFIIGGVAAVEGAQSPEYIAQAIDQAARQSPEAERVA
ncbi:MAG: DsbA family oxidoreductase [Xanthobacteraceae bacterium]|jgi:predicted DsbA family dithiol-disulfide isomerase